MQIVQTVALVIASVVAVYTLATTDVSRRRDSRRERLDKVLERVLDLMAAVTEWRGSPAGPALVRPSSASVAHWQSLAASGCIRGIF